MRWKTLSRTKRLTAAAVVAALAAGSTTLAIGSDHQDTPEVELNPRMDMTDVYAFPGTGPDRIALVMNSRAVWPVSDSRRALLARLPECVRDRVVLVDDWTRADNPFDAVLYHGGAAGLSDALAKVAARPGPILPVYACAAGDYKIGLERLLVERVISVNTAAAGGNASLMTIG